MGEDRERDKQIHNGDVGRDFGENGETRSEGKTETDTNFDVTSSTIPVPYHEQKMDRRRTRKIRQKMSGGIESDDQIAAT